MFIFIYSWFVYFLLLILVCLLLKRCIYVGNARKISSSSSVIAIHTLQVDFFFGEKTCAMAINYIICVCVFTFDKIKRETFPRLRNRSHIAREYYCFNYLTNNYVLLTELMEIRKLGQGTFCLIILMYVHNLVLFRQVYQMIDENVCVLCVTCRRWKKCAIGIEMSVYLFISIVG